MLHAVELQDSVTYFDFLVRMLLGASRLSSASNVFFLKSSGIDSASSESKCCNPGANVNHLIVKVKTLHRMNHSGLVTIESTGALQHT